MNNPGVTFDAIFHAYKFNKHVEDCLNSLIRHHPSTNVYVCIDGGGDGEEFRSVTSKYNIKEIICYEENILPKARFKDKDSPKKYVERILNLLSFCTREWTILLEDDVRIVKPITALPQLVDAAGPIGHPISNDLICNINNYTTNSLTNNNYGFCGGTMFKTNLFENLNWNKINFQNLIELDWRCGSAGDICLSVLAYLNNKTYGRWTEYGELNNPQEENNNCSVLHNVK